MKNKIILILLAISFITISGFAQVVNEPTPDTRNKLHLGVKAGYNFSKVYDTQGEQFKTKPKFGFAGGLFLSIPIGRYFGIQPEALFSQRGFRGTGTLLGSSYKMTRTTSYLDFPVLISVKPSKYISLMAGPQFSYTIKQKDVFSDSGATIQQQEEFNNSNVRKNTLCFLTGFDININHGVLGVRAGWDLQKNNGDGSSTTPRYKNIWMQATLGFRI